jgi:hypothetical protein
MGQITITLPPELEHEIEEYLGFQRDEEDLSRLVRDALSDYLQRQRSRLRIVNPDRPYRTLRITPAAEGSGLSDVSINHDKYLAEDLMRERTKE